MTVALRDAFDSIDGVAVDEPDGRRVALARYAARDGVTMQDIESLADLGVVGFIHAELQDGVEVPLQIEMTARPVWPDAIVIRDIIRMEKDADRRTADLDRMIATGGIGTRGAGQSSIIRGGTQRRGARRIRKAS